MSWISSCFSSECTAWLAADCETCSDFAAFEKLRREATSQKIFTFLKCMALNYKYGEYFMHVSIRKSDSSLHSENSVRQVTGRGTGGPGQRIGV